jgi:hypothetical protein
MKIIQSFWSKPSLDYSEDKNARFNGGWSHQKYAFYSFALSALTIKKHYDCVELYTDNYGLELFQDVLQLPYDKIHVNLNALDNYNSKLWAIGKLISCSIQKEPFLHLDNDIFLWDKISYNEEDFDLLAQNLEIDYPNYTNAFNFILENFNWIPDEIKETHKKSNKILAYNAGVIGGKNFDFFKELKLKAFKFIDENIDFLEKIDVGIFNTIFEQQLGYALTEKNKLKIQFLFDKVEANFEQVIDFSSVPINSKYIHCIGFAKKSIFATEQIEARLAYHFPQFYKDLNIRLDNHYGSNLYSASSISSKRMEFLFDYYTLMDNNDLDSLFKLKFKISNKCKIEIDENDNAFIEFLIPQLNEIDKKELHGWSSILLYFQESVSIKELYEDLIADVLFMKNFDNVTDFKMKLISFTLEKALMLEILIPEI